MAIAQGAPPTGEPAALDCPHADRCPGCPLIALSYEAGLALKAERLARALGRYPELQHANGGAGVQAAATFESYRLRAKLVTDAAGRLGLFAAGSHDVVDIPGCRVQARELADVARALRELLPLELPLRGVDLRLCDEGVLVCLIVEGEPDRAALERVERQLLARLPRVSGLALNIAQPESVQLLGARLEVLSGAAAQPHHFDPEAPWHYASHGAFTQVHGKQTVRLHERIEVQLGEKLGGLRGRRVLELYAGSGSLALRLAARGAHVTAVEAFAPALERVALAARAQSLDVDTWSGDAEAFLRELAASPSRPAIDAVLVNPPRRGLAPSVRAALAKLAPRLISYVSCEPETLARDLVLFELSGYRAAAVEAFDMIPLSDAVESLALLEPAPALAPRVLFEDETSLALFKLPFESTSGRGESGFSLLDRARHAFGEPGLAPVHRLDVGTSGACWFARRPELVPALADALARGGETYLALARGFTHGKGKITRPLVEAGQRRAALTRYRRVSVVSGHSLLEVRPEQARKHQLRRHLASIGHPILGDARYGHEASNRHFEHRFGLDRPFLHCVALTLDRGGGPIEIRAPLAGDLAAVLDATGGLRGGPL